MNNNLPAIKREGIFIKIKNWFLRLFKKYERTDEYFLEESSRQLKNKTDFVDNIKVENNGRIFILQRKIKEKQMEISDLTNQELDQLIELYKEQIEEKKMKLKQYRLKIVK